MLKLSRVNDQALQTAADNAQEYEITDPATLAPSGGIIRYIGHHSSKCAAPMAEYWAADKILQKQCGDNEQQYKDLVVVAWCRYLASTIVGWSGVCLGDDDAETPFSHEQATALLVASKAIRKEYEQHHFNPALFPIAT